MQRIFFLMCSCSRFFAFSIFPLENLSEVYHSLLKKPSNLSAAAKQHQTKTNKITTPTELQDFVGVGVAWTTLQSSIVHYTIL